MYKIEEVGSGGGGKEGGGGWRRDEEDQLFLSPVCHCSCPTTLGDVVSSK